MTEEEFRARFDLDRQQDKLTTVADDDIFGIAVGLRGPSVIVLHDGNEIAIADARFLELDF